METQNAKSIREVGNRESSRPVDGLRRRDTSEKVSDSFVTKLKRTAAVVGLASALYFAPNARAQNNPTLDSTVETELSNLVVANGGSSTTISSYVNGTRSDGVNLSSTIQQLESASDYPPVLVNLLQKYNIPTPYTVQAGFVSLYNDTAGSPLTTTMVTELTNLVSLNGGAITTVQSYVNGTRSDGVTLNSTVAQLEGASDAPAVLVNLLNRYSISSSTTVQQAFIDLAGYTTGAPGN
jgi:hypothetical protein